MTTGVYKITEGFEKVLSDYTETHVKFKPVGNKTTKGAYHLYPTKVDGSVLEFTADRYTPNAHGGISFTSHYNISS